jgi:hypothetical protein
VYTDSEHPPHDLPEVSGGLAVEFALEPDRELAEVSGQVSDALPDGFEFLPAAFGRSFRIHRKVR